MPTRSDIVTLLIEDYYGTREGFIMRNPTRKLISDLSPYLEIRKPYPGILRVRILPDYIKKVEAIRDMERL